MGKRKSDILEDLYKEVDSRFRNTSEEGIIAEIGRTDAQIESIKEEMEKLQETINSKKQLIDVLESKEQEGQSNRIQKAIEDAKVELKDAQEKLKNKETIVSRMNKSKVSLKAYSKNKDQINKIRTFKANIAKKLSIEITKRDESKTKMEAAEASLKDANKKLADEKLTMEMDQYEYNALLEQKAQAERDVKEQTEIYKKAKDRIIELQTKIGKCDLAWKTLFSGKSWDDIQRRALDPNRKFVRHIDDEEQRLTPPSENGKKLSPEEQMKDDIARTVDAVKNEQGKDTKEGDGKKTDLPAPVPKHPRWEKFKNFFKKAGHKLKEIFVGENENQEPDYSKMNNIPVDKRDQFLEELRKHVDIEYGKQARDGKEAQYIEQHKVKTKEKTAESQEKDER